MVKATPLGLWFQRTIIPNGRGNVADMLVGAES